jgi:hypothetical protein
VKYFHINYIARTRWFAPILRKLHSVGALSRSNWPTEYALSVNTKFEILGCLRASLDHVICELDENLRQNQKEVDRCIAERGEKAGPYPLDLGLAFRIVTVLECFISEALSTWDIAISFAVRLCRNSGRRIGKRALEKELKANGVNLSWLDLRERLRNLHVHEGSIWIGVQVTSDDPRRYELIVLRRNTLDLADAQDWIGWSELKALDQGLSDGLDGLQAWLMQLEFPSVVERTSPV